MFDPKQLAKMSDEALKKDGRALQAAGEALEGALDPVLRFEAGTMKLRGNLMLLVLKVPAAEREAVLAKMWADASKPV